MNDLTIVSYKAKAVIQKVRDCGYELKGGNAPETFLCATIERCDAPETFLGVTIARHTFQNGTSTWY